MFDPSGGFRRELDIVGEVSGESLMEADIDCDMHSRMIQQSELQLRDDRRLHIHANIELGKIITTA